MDINAKYFAKTETVKGKHIKDNLWEGDTLIVSILEKKEDGSEIKIGEYNRSYSNLYQTFYPFIQYGKEYALFATGAYSTKVMELPSCKEIATEQKGRWSGFCPVEYYVPYDPKRGVNGQFGFLVGCGWGDDHTWKIRHLDLSKIHEGIVEQSPRFGYIHMIDIKQASFSLKDSIDLWYDTSDPDPENHEYKVIIKCAAEFDMRDGTKLD